LRRVAEAPTMAREYIALDRGIALREVTVEVVSVRMEGPVSRELLESGRQIKDMRARAAAYRFAISLLFSKYRRSVSVS
jgi:hypothetical protein